MPWAESHVPQLFAGFLRSKIRRSCGQMPSASWRDLNPWFSNIMRKSLLYPAHSPVFWKVNTCQKLMADFVCVAQNKYTPQKQAKISIYPVPVLKMVKWKRAPPVLREESYEIRHDRVTGKCRSTSCHWSEKDAQMVFQVTVAKPWKKALALWAQICRQRICRGYK